MISAQLKSRGYDLVLKSVTKLPDDVQAAAAIGLARGLLITVGSVQRSFLSGPRPAVLDVVTTRLRNSISSEVHQDIQTHAVTGTIGSNVRYAAYHEFGFHGTQAVTAFTRVIRQIAGTGGTFDGRRAINDRAGRRIGFKETRKEASRKQKTGVVEVQFVKAHTRKINYAGRPFVAPALARNLPVILAEVNAEIAKIKPPQT